MRSFETFRGEKVFLHPDTSDHIRLVHPEIKISMIKETLEDSDEVRRSSSKDESEIYYFMRKKNQIYLCCGKNL